MEIYPIIGKCTKIKNTISSEDDLFTELFASIERFGFLRPSSG